MKYFAKAKELESKISKESNESKISLLKKSHSKINSLFDGKLAIDG